ncbi:MAG: hypothetical protein KI785_09790 [Devosiaceae bacterium]|nr:hypothetical protein [Devosiaceae bacterium MH13]
MDGNVRADAQGEAGQVYVSVTGLKLHSPLVWLRFSLLASKSFRQAMAAPGNLSASARQVDGVHHTLTVWQSREAMLAYLRSGPHLRAMRASNRLGAGKTCGYYADAAPSWEAALAVWRAKAQAV